MMLAAVAAVSCNKDGSAVVNVSVSPSELTVPYTRSTDKSFEVQADGAWTVKALSSAGHELSWVRFGRMRGNGNAKVTLTVNANEYKDSRVAKLTVTSASGNVAVVELTQEGNPNSQVSNNEITVRVGTYNVRYNSSNEKEPQNNWDNRKSRLIQSINDNAFDFFGVNEARTTIQSYLNEQLGRTYSFKYFSPYSQNGEGDKAMGLAYKKSFTLSDWHYFWLGTDPDKMVENDESDGTKYKRGGACGILTHNDTGIKIFVMVAHGALSAQTRASFAYLFAQMEAKYNPKGYPSFFVGDMNAREGDPASVEYRKYWKDAYQEADDRKGPFSTFNAFDLSLNLNNDKRRIDYVYYRNATLLNYVCNDKKYGGYYASDHLPVYSDMRIGTTVE